MFGIPFDFTEFMQTLLLDPEEFFHLFCKRRVARRAPAIPPIADPIHTPQSVESDYESYESVDLTEFEEDSTSKKLLEKPEIPARKIFELSASQVLAGAQAVIQDRKDSWDIENITPYCENKRSPRSNSMFFLSTATDFLFANPDPKRTRASSMRNGFSV